MSGRGSARPRMCRHGPRASGTAQRWQRHVTGSMEFLQVLELAIKLFMFINSLPVRGLFTEQRAKHCSLPSL